MNRTFQARVTLPEILLLILLSGVSIWCLWTRMIVIAIFFLLFLLVLIEKIIHTQYVLTPDGNLIIDSGRFLKKKIISLETVASIEAVCSSSFFGYSLQRYVLLQIRTGRPIAVIPRNEASFIETAKRFINKSDFPDEKV